MKSFVYTFSYLFCILVLTSGCGKKVHVDENKIQRVDSTYNNEPDNYQKTVSVNNPKNSIDTAAYPKMIDTATYVIDTTLTLPSYRLVVTKEKYDILHHPITLSDLDYNPIIIHVVRLENDSIIYTKKFEENQFVSLYSFKEQSINYISLSTYSGGSGFVSTIYKLELNEHTSFTAEYTYNELTFYTFSKDGSELLVLQGIWDMTEVGGEAHYSEHKYTISSKTLITPGSAEILHGTTKHKYASYDYEITTEMLIEKINKKEPASFKGINLDEFLK